MLCTTAIQGVSSEEKRQATVGRIAEKEDFKPGVKNEWAICSVL